MSHRQVKTLCRSTFVQQVHFKCCLGFYVFMFLCAECYRNKDLKKAQSLRLRNSRCGWEGGHINKNNIRGNFLEPCWSQCDPWTSNSSTASWWEIHILQLYLETRRTIIYILTRSIDEHMQIKVWEALSQRICLTQLWRWVLDFFFKARSCQKWDK